LIIPFTSTEVLPVPKLAQRRSHLNAFDQRGFRCGSRFSFSIECALFSPFFSAPFTLSYEGQGMFLTRISGVFLGRAAASQTSVVDPLPASPGMACWMRRSRSISLLAMMAAFLVASPVSRADSSTPSDASRKRITSLRLHDA